MANGIWALAKLTPEQMRLLEEAERTLGGNVLLAYTQVDVEPTPLSESQLECLQGLEKKTGLTVLAVTPAKGSSGGGGGPTITGTSPR